MKARFSLFLLAVSVSWTVYAQTTIHVADPQTWTTDALAPYVGQTVIFDVPMVVCSNEGGYTISTHRLFTPTNQVLPKFKDTESYNAFVSLNTAGRLTLTGGSGYHRCGEKIYNLKVKVNSTSSVSWVSGVWKGNTQNDLLKTNVHKEIGVENCDSCLTVCAYNLEWYDINKTTKQRKINAALTLIDADILGLIEIEGKEATSKRVVDLLNSTLPNRTYKYYYDSKSDAESQTVVYIYDSKRVKQLGSIQHIDRRISNRKKMMCFELIKTGERFIYSVNHFKAKTGGGSGANANMGDGQGGWNADRQEEAQAVMDEYKNWSRQIDEPDILLMGDLNSYGKEDPITVLKTNGMTDLHRVFHADSSYSYQYGGEAGYLDHALCNNSMRPQVTGMMVLHCNSDEQRNRSETDNTMFCGSDHDPVVVGLKLDGSLSYDPAPKINNSDIFNGTAEKLIIRDAYKDDQKSFYAIYNTSGHLLERHDILNEIEEVEIPKDPGMYVVYIYFDGQAYQRRIIVR